MEPMIIRLYYTKWWLEAFKLGVGLLDSYTKGALWALFEGLGVSFCTILK